MRNVFLKGCNYSDEDESFAWFALGSHLSWGGEALLYSVWEEEPSLQAGRGQGHGPGCVGMEAAPSHTPAGPAAAWAGRLLAVCHCRCGKVCSGLL